MVSRRTGFTIEYLVEITGNLDINSCTFEGLAKLYNRVHNGKLPYDILAKRVEVCRKRIADAFFLYSYLELAQRYNIPNYQIIIQGDLDLTIEQHQEKFQTIFREKWSLKHKCDKPGCGKALIVDAGLKPHRKLCGAKLSGIREFQKANVKVFTGCRKIPKPESKFCQEHEETDTPVVPAEKVSRQTRRKLRDFREDSSKSELAGQDNFYIVESIIDVKKSPEGDLYKVKLVGFPVSEASWEPKSSIPKFILKYYDSGDKFGQPLPNPRVKYSKNVGDAKYHFLSWDGEKGGKWLHKDYFKILDDDAEVVETLVEGLT